MVLWKMILEHWTIFVILLCIDPVTNMPIFHLKFVHPTIFVLFFVYSFHRWTFFVSYMLFHIGFHHNENTSALYLKLFIKPKMQMNWYIHILFQLWVIEHDICTCTVYIVEENRMIIFQPANPTHTQTLIGVKNKCNAIKIAFNIQYFTINSKKMLKNEIQKNLWFFVYLLISEAIVSNQPNNIFQICVLPEHSILLFNTKQFNDAVLITTFKYSMFSGKMKIIEITHFHLCAYLIELNWKMIHSIRLIQSIFSI